MSKNEEGINIKYGINDIYNVQRDSNIDNNIIKIKSTDTINSSVSLDTINSSVSVNNNNNINIDANVLIDACETLGLPELHQVYEEKTKPTEFKILRTLAKGGYGEVYVVEFNQAIYAMKKVAKQTVLKNSNTTFFMNEKCVMTSVTSEWLVQCHACVQDEYWLYYLMDFIPGGDLMGYLSRIDVLSETGIRFFAAEIFAAVNAMHENGWIHRDLKPDNILIGHDGHIKLGDFGSSIAMIDGKAESFITVGTPDYVSPDLLVKMGERIEYGPEVDFWTVGVIIYEMLCGTTPFYSESLVETYGKISRMAYEFPEGIVVSEELQSLIGSLLCEKKRRLDFVRVKKHLFFAEVNWDNLQQAEAFYIPQVGERDDISNFVDTDFIPDTSKVRCDFRKFVGFTFDPIHCTRLLKNLGCKLPNIINNGINMKLIDKKIVYYAVDDAKNIVDNETIRVDKTKMTDNKKEIEDNTVTLTRFNKKDNICEICHIHKINEDKDINLNNKRILEQNIIIDKETILENETLLDSETILIIKNISKTVLGEMLIEAMDLLRDLREVSLVRRLSGIKKIVNKLQQQNEILTNDLEKSQIRCGEMARRQEELKKELRIRRTEVRECQQRIEQEIYLRCELEKELEKFREKERKNQQPRLVKTRTVSVIATDAMTNRTLGLDIRDKRLILSNFPSDCLNKYILARVEGDQLICSLEHIFVRDLKNHELHHMPYKKRSLVAVVHFLGEPNRISSSGGTRRSLQALETDLFKEEKILRGLENLIKVLDGVTLTDALAQKQGSEKKMEQLRNEIEKAKKSTLTEYEVEDDEKVAEFNNHLFYEKTVAKGTLCDNCNDPLYGHVKQAYCCRDCLLVVHKHCYILVDISCEMRQSMKKGTFIYIACRTAEEKERLIKITN